MTLAQAFRALIHQLLVKNEEELTVWRQALLAALEPNGQLVVDLAPELELLIPEGLRKSGIGGIALVLIELAGSE